MIGANRYGGITGLPKRHRAHGRVLIGVRPWDAARAIPRASGEPLRMEDIPPIPPPSPFHAARDELARKHSSPR